MIGPQEGGGSKHGDVTEGPSGVRAVSLYQRAQLSWAKKRDQSSPFADRKMPRSFLIKKKSPNRGWRDQLNREVDTQEDILNGNCSMIYIFNG